MLNKKIIIFCTLLVVIVVAAVDLGSLIKSGRTSNQLAATSEIGVQAAPASAPIVDLAFATSVPSTTVISNDVADDNSFIADTTQAPVEENLENKTEASDTSNGNLDPFWPVKVIPSTRGYSPEPIHPSSGGSPVTPIITPGTSTPATSTPATTTPATSTPPIVQTNLIPNSIFSIDASSGLPTGWRQNPGQSNATFSFDPATGTMPALLNTNITSIVSGDAKWYFPPLTLTPGVYSYSDQYMSTVPSRITLQLQNSDGTNYYKDLISLPASNSLSSSSAMFSVPAGAQNVTVFHLINSVGSLSVGGVGLFKKSDPAGVFTTGAISLRFDDGDISQYNNAIPIMASSSLKGTFYVVTKQIADNGFAGYMSKAQVIDLAQKGYEIGDHSSTHPHLTTLTPEQLSSEVSGSKQELESWGIGPVYSFAYPFGEDNDQVIQAVKSAGFTDAASTKGGDVTQASNRYLLESRTVGSSVDFAQVKKWIDNAVSKKEWLILTFHQIDNSGTTYSTTPALFKQIVDYIKTQPSPVVTISQGAQSLLP